VERKWPTWPDLESLAQKATNIAMATNDTSHGQLTPMDHWRLESAQQSPWNNIAAIQAGSERRPSEFGEEPRDGSQGGDTDNGTVSDILGA